MRIELPYEPLPHQAEFHEDDSFIRLASGGVRSGKTVAGAVECLLMALESPGIDGLILAPTYKTLHGVTLREFRSILPPELIAGESKGEGYIELVNKCRVYYRSADNPMSYEGMTLGFFWADEIRYWRRESYDVLQARLSSPNAKKLRGICTSTPAMNWMYDEFCADVKGRSLIRFRTTDNHHLHDNYIENLRASMSEAKAKQYLDGFFVAIEGAVFPNFSIEENVCDLDPIPGLELHYCFDPGFRCPAVGIFQHVPVCHLHGVRDCIHYLDEILDDNSPTRVIAPKIREMMDGYYMEHHTPISVGYLDPAARNKSVQEGYSDIDYLESEGLQCKWTTRKACRNIPNGLEVIRSKLKSSTGQRSIFISDRLTKNKRGLIRALQNTTYPPRSSNGQISEAPVKDDKTHILDAFRYAMVNLFPPYGNGLRFY